MLVQASIGLLQTGKDSTFIIIIFLAFYSFYLTIFFYNNNIIINNENSFITIYFSLKRYVEMEDFFACQLMKSVDQVRIKLGLVTYRLGLGEKSHFMNW